MAWETGKRAGGRGWLWLQPLLGVVLAGSASAGQPASLASPLAPREALRHLQVDEGLTIELAACEPQVIDPVAIAFDERHRLWVVEMRDYPNGPPPGQPPRSCIKLLEDRNADGFYETAHLFADELPFPTGVAPWRGGVIVTLAGEIAWMADTNGDHQADVRETWFRGFAEENPQLRANHPRLALDNHVYVANGLRGGTILANARHWGREWPEVSIQGKDFRFDPISGKCQAVAGHGQFGLSFDDFGRRFICTNRNPCRQVVIEDRYLAHNPFVALVDVAHDVSPAAENSRLFPLSRAWTTSNLHAHQFTAACGVHRYRGDLLPDTYRQSSFTCDPTANLVHRDLLRAGRNGAVAALESDYPNSGREFLASPDEWFRPVDLADGPDGALYVVDMYRAVIEHPEFVPDELKRRPDLRFGDDRGRIYRIRPAAQAAPARAAVLADMPLEHWVAALEDPNGWRRDTAARLILERQDSALCPMLEALAHSSKSPAARARALWLLEGLGGLTEAVLLQALADPAGGVQEQALVLAEPRLKGSETLNRALLSLQPAREFDVPRVTFQHLLSLAAAGDAPEKFVLLARYALDRAEEVWVRKAALLAAGNSPRRFLEAVLSREPPRASPAANVARDFSKHELVLAETAELIGARRQPDEIEALLAMLVSLFELRQNRDGPAMQRLVLAGLAALGDGIVRRGGTLEASVAELEAKRPGITAALQPIFAEAARMAVEPSAGEQRRGSALAALRHAPFDTSRAALLALAADPSDQALRLRAIGILAGHDDRIIDDTLLELFSAGTPAVRRAALQGLARGPARLNRLFDALAEGRASAAEIDPATAKALLGHADQGVRERAAGILAALVPAQRQRVLEAYQPALAMKGSAPNGRPLFEKHCAGCHRVGGLGVDVAPDIADSRTKTPAQLLVDILNPNQAIDANYVSYTALLRSGQTETGVISAETATSVTLRQPEGKTVVLLRADLEELRSNGVSLMPEGFEKQLSVAELADLISFLKNWRYLDGLTPLAE